MSDTAPTIGSGILDPSDARYSGNVSVLVVGGGGFKRGVTVGETSSDGREVVGESYSSEDLMASVLKSLGISLETTFTAKNGRPMKIANSGKVIKELFA